MIKNYFKIAWRSLWKNKLYTTLNVAGLTFGISCFLLIGLYLFDELTFDEQHSKADRIYRVIENKTVNGEATTIAAAGYKLAEESKRSIAEVENTTCIQRTGRANLLTLKIQPIFSRKQLLLRMNKFLEIFDFPLIAGDKKTALQEPNSIIINEDLARRLFNKTDVLGKTLQFSFLGTTIKDHRGFKKSSPQFKF